MRTLFRLLSLKAGVALAAGACLLTVPVHGQEPGAGDSEKPAALARRAAALLAARASLTTTFEIVTEFEGRYRDTRETGTITLARPNFVHIEIDRYRRVGSASSWEATGNGSAAASDGTTAWNLIRHPASAQYEVQPATDTWKAASLAPFPPLQRFFADSASASPTPVRARYSGQREDGGETFDVVEEEATSETRTLWYDADGLLRRVVVARAADESPAARSGKPTGGRASFVRREVRIAKPVSLPTDRPIRDRFAYQPPASAVRLDGRVDAAPLLSVGALAPNFTTENIDGHPVRLADFAGKVVVLKFWATWCWPCRQSLPATEQLAKAYASGDKEVVVLAVALWDSRKAFRDWVGRYARERGVPPSGLPIRFAFDPQPQGKDAATALYGVRATPTEFVIGRDGRLAAVESGYTGANGRTQTAVHAALGVRAPAQPETAAAGSPSR